MKYQLHTYGCKVNTYDSGLLQTRLARAGFSPALESPQVHILNTCAVTREATREAVKTARRLKARDPFALVVVTGCAAQVDTEEFAHVPGVDLVVANSHKGQLETLIQAYYRGELRDRVYKSNIFKKEDLEAGGGEEAEHTRAFLKIQDGCNSFCTYCVIPFARGKSRSLTVAEICDRINAIERTGVREVVLTGVHIADYRDGAHDLESLVEQVLARTMMPRLRLSSLEPGELSPRLLDLYASNERLCRHFHMSIQSANSKVLFEMKRQYTAEAVEQSLNAIAERLPGSYVGMDVIAGFPGETDDEFLDSYERLRRLPWTRLHVFPYSERPGTYAARRVDAVVPVVARKRRAAMLRALSSERLAAQATAQIGSIKTALGLRNGGWLTRDYWPLRADVAGVNEERRFRVIGTLENGQLAAAPV